MRWRGGWWAARDAPTLLPPLPCAPPPALWGACSALQRGGGLFLDPQVSPHSSLAPRAVGCWSWPPTLIPSPPQASPSSPGLVYGAAGPCLWRAA